MVLLDVSATGKENIIETDNSKEMNDLSYRAKQLKSLQETVIDLEDVSGGISITDLTLNDFKMDLMGYLKDNEDNLTRSPKGIHSVVLNSQNSSIAKGVIFCLRLLNNDIKSENYSLEPYYLVYVDENNELKLGFSNAKTILDIYKKLCVGSDKAVDEAVKLFENDTDNYKDMSYYTSKLQVAVQSILGKKEEDDVESLFGLDETSFKSSDELISSEFELISYLVIK